MRKYDLVAFDVDGTLVSAPRDHTVWEVLNEKFCGTNEMNKQRYALYKAGRLSYAEWVDLDISGWQAAGASKAEMIAGFAPLKLIDGVRETLVQLRDQGCRLFAISGTLDLMLETLYPGHPFEEVLANRIWFDDAGHISRWQATPYDMQGKAEGLRELSRRERIPLTRCAYVGDSSNDVWIGREAGFTIAFNPKDAEFEKLAGAVVHGDDLRAILPYLLAEKA